MSALANFDANEIISSSDNPATMPAVTLAGPGSPAVSSASPAASHADPALGASHNAGRASAPSEEPPLDSAVIEQVMSQAIASHQPLVPEAQPEAQAPEEVNPETQEQQKPLSSAQQRIMQLVAERNQAREEAQRVALQTQAQLAQIQRQMADQQAAFQRQQLEIENRRIAMEEARRAAEEEARLPDVERARRKFIADTKAQARQEIDPALQALQNKITQMEQRDAAREQEARRQERMGQFRQQASNVLDSVLLSGYSPEDQKALKDGMEEMLYSYAGAFGVNPVQAAQPFKQFLSNYFKAEAKRISTQAGPKVAQSQQAPRSVPVAASVGTPGQGAWPTLKQLQKGDGKRSFDNHVQWVAAGRPALVP